MWWLRHASALLPLPCNVATAYLNIARISGLSQRKSEGVGGGFVGFVGNWMGWWVWLGRSWRGAFGPKGIYPFAGYWRLKKHLDWRQYVILP
jgi:hypothetical protein